jgi:hypothetical protein
MNRGKELCYRSPGSFAYGSAAEQKPLQSAKENKVCGTMKSIGHC